MKHSALPGCGPRGSVSPITTSFRSITDAKAISYGAVLRCFFATYVVPEVLIHDQPLSTPTVRNEDD